MYALTTGHLLRSERKHPIPEEGGVPTGGVDNRKVPKRKERLDPYRRVRKPVPPPERVERDRRREIEEREARREAEEKEGRER
jgi:hypothetical protein